MFALNAKVVQIGIPLIYGAVFVYDLKLYRRSEKILLFLQLQLSRSAIEAFRHFVLDVSLSVCSCICC